MAMNDDIWIDTENEEGKIFVYCSPVYCLELTLDEAKKWRQQIDDWISLQEQKLKLKL